MPVTVLLSTTLRLSVPGYDPAKGLSLDWERPISTGALAEKIGLPLKEIKIVMLNGRHANLEQMVNDGDRVSYFPAVGGG
ncbi:MAG: MoaD/ThiS family protein [Desulfovibrionaceae bacterium]|nr:MoaD/ThiS family protein [Desulfovibrionaceae bacterium]